MRKPAQTKPKAKKARWVASKAHEAKRIREAERKEGKKKPPG